MIIAAIMGAIALTAGVALAAVMIVDAYDYVKRGEHEYEEG